MSGLPTAGAPTELPSQEHRRHRGPLNWHTRPASRGPLRLAVKNTFVAMVGEFVGTTMFLLIALGGTKRVGFLFAGLSGFLANALRAIQCRQHPYDQFLYIALSFGFSLAVNAWIFFRVSGGLFNPAVSLGMAIAGALTPLRAIFLTISQILGGIVGAAIIQALLPGTLNVATKLSPGTSVARGLFLEMFLTALLMLAILLLAAEKHKATFLAPIGIGLALFVAELVGVYYTGGSLNPARSFGPAVVLRSFDGYHWIYWVGPFLGTLLAAGFYKFIKYLEYETVLGPEEPDTPSPSSSNNQNVQNNDKATPGRNLVAPSATLLGSTAAGASGSTRATPTTATTSMGEKEVHPADQKGMVAVQGPGLPDLLTTGHSGGVFDLPQPSYDYRTRLERIESLLETLIAGAGAHGRKVSTEGTVVGVDETRHEWHKVNDSPV
uniref:FGENESH: predicted gene_5.206 protein n=1 Tax=Rhodotorula toruloides TaxID=5286 RepID=A0A0K3CE49_RHOTO